MTDLGTLNSATKYPSIETYHELDPANGRLVEDKPTAFDGPVILTEKVDGTNGRVIVMPDGDWFIGSREELLHAHGDRIENPALGIVPALLPLAPTLARSPAGIRVYFLEVYGHKIGGAAKQYTKAGVTGFRLFDVADVPMSVPEEMTREQVSSWREHGGQVFMREAELIRIAGGHGGVPLAPRLGTVPGRGLPRDLEGMQKFLTGHAASTRAALDEGAAGAAEGIVLRTADRSVIAKARFQDYDRTLRRRKP
jgi:hypothetical protein